MADGNAARGGSGRAREPRTKATPARLLALELTRERRVRDAYLRELVDARRETTDLPPEEFAYAQVLSFGVVMCEGTLDYLIDRNLNSPHDVKPKLRDALRISAYELLFLGKPAHVVVDQGVEIARSAAPRAAGLANAVLRKMSRDAASFPWGDPDHDDGAFARNYGVPLWLAHAFIGQYGRARAAEVLASCLEPAPTYLVDNPYRPGERFASDLAAQAVAALVPLDGTALLEIGAGRGTKTMLLERRALGELGHAVPVHAVDVHAFKCELLEARMREMRVPEVTAHAADARDLSAVAGLPPSFSSVLLDAPCSGTGTLRRHPETRWRLAPADVESLADLQRQLLVSASRRVGLGGTLVYATCSVLSEEDERVVEDFLESGEGTGFRLEPLSPSSPAWSFVGGPAQDVPFFRTVPTSGGPDGHFAAVLHRVS